jgi:hypothetical protein
MSDDEDRKRTDEDPTVPSAPIPVPVSPPPDPEKRRPRLTPDFEERLAPIDEKSAASYADAEAAIATKAKAGELLDELLQAVDEGGVPQAVLEMTESLVHEVARVTHPKKPPER